MAEPSSGAVAVAIGAGAGFAGFLAAFNGDAAVGSLCGALIYFAAAQELPLAKRLLYFVISFIMGYQFAPLLAKAEINVFGAQIGPLALPGPVAFIAAALVVGVTLAAIRKRAQAIPGEG
ncbi:putative phage holin [compost metagenome]